MLLQRHRTCWTIPKNLSSMPHLQVPLSGLATHEEGEPVEVAERLRAHRLQYRCGFRLYVLIEAPSNGMANHTAIAHLPVNLMLESCKEPESLVPVVVNRTMRDRQSCAERA